jgi:Undecaprenyl-phosphate galactose phosphotransferase WbaP
MSSEIFPGLFVSTQPLLAPRDVGEAEVDNTALSYRPAFAWLYAWQAVRTGLPLWLADQVSVLAGLGIGCGVAYLAAQDGPFSFGWLAAVLCAGLSGSNYGFGLYPGVGLGATAELRRCTVSCTIVFGMFFLATALHEGLFTVHTTLITSAWIGVFMLMPALRQWTRRMASKTTWWGQPLLVLGADAESAIAYRKLLAIPEQGLRPIGVLDEPHRYWSEPQYFDAEHYLGALTEAGQIAAEKGAFWGLVSMERHADEDLARVIDRYAATIPHLLILTHLGNPPRIWHGAHECGGMAGVRIDERLLLPVPRLTKRIMDLVLTCVGGVLVLPLVALIAVVVKCSSPGPVLYWQERVGFGGRTFRAWKFRSMVVNAEAELEKYLKQDPRRCEEWDRFQKLRNDPRVTKVGRFLRMTSLDELPQLWNVLRNEMSLVGPRPMMPSQIKDYPTFHLYVRLVPGITGLWQINGRNFTTFVQRSEFDAEYIRNWSPWLDLCVLARTIKVALLCEGSY